MRVHDDLWKCLVQVSRTGICLAGFLLTVLSALAEETNAPPKKPDAVGMAFTAMPPYPKGPEEYLNKWDLFVIGSLTGAKETMALTNGRQIARDSIGGWFVLVEGDGTSLRLGLARGERVVGGDFDTIELVGPSKSAVFKAKGKVAGASMVMDGADTLHIVWCEAGGLVYAKRNARVASAESLADRSAWGRPVPLVEPTCEPGDIMLDPSRQPVVCYSRDDTVFYRSLAPGAKPEAAGGLATGMVPLVQPQVDRKAVAEKDPAAPIAPKPKTPSWPPPRPIEERRSQEAVMDLGTDGTVHLAFRRDFDIWYARRTPDGKWQAPERAAWGLAFHPSIIEADDRPLICFQLEGLRQAALGGEKYLAQREGGGSSIAFAVRTANGWRTDYLAKAEEIIVNRQGIWDKRYEGKLVPMVEEMWRPVLFRDRHGVPWALWQNTTRRWSYYARWLGEGFGEVQECRGPFNAPGQPVSAEKLMPVAATDVGLIFFAADRVIFDRLKIPTLSMSEDREVLFLDCLEVAQTAGAEFVVNQATKHPNNPILSPAPLGQKDGLRISHVIDYRVRTIDVATWGRIGVVYQGYSP